MYVLMISRDLDAGTFMMSTDEFVGVFTRYSRLEPYVLTTPLAEEGAAYYVLECEPDQPGVARRIDIAMTKLPEEDRNLAGSPVQVMVPVGQDGAPLIDLQNLPPFAIEVFGSKEHRSLLRLFESPAGILEAQYDPKDLSEAAQRFVTELQKIQMTAYGVNNGE